MDTGICDIQVLNNPSRKYASTVNLVFFRAYPLYKNFQIYVDGLKRWSQYKKYFPECQLQIFVDQAIAEDESIMKMINALEARVFLVRCPDFLTNEKYHIGIFPMFWRMFPAFDVFEHPFKIAHSQELEPAEEDIESFKDMNAVRNLNYPKLGFVHRTQKLIDSNLKTKSKIEGVLDYPQVFGGRIIICSQAPFEVLTNFFEKAKRGEVGKGMYESSKIKKEHGRFPFGIDETFLNSDYSEWMIKNGYAIGIMTTFKPSYPLWYAKDILLKNSKSKDILNYILQKDQSVKDSLAEIDKLYYKYPANAERVDECSARFYEVVDKNPDWLGKATSFLIKRVFNGYSKRKCIIMVRNNKIEDVIDLK